MGAETEESRESGQKQGYLKKAISIKMDLYDEVATLASYNKLTGKEPSTRAGVTEEALRRYLEASDKGYRQFMLRK